MARQAITTLTTSLVIALILMTAGIGGVIAQESTTPDDEPHLEITIELDDDGTAHWSIDYRVVVETSEQEEAFEQLAAAVRAGEVELPLTIDTMEAYLAASAANDDREMAITDAGWHDTIEDEIGTLSLALTWEGFAEDEGSSLSVGDVFHANEGLWLETLGEDARLTIIPPDSYELEDAPANASVEGDSISWDGPQVFDAASFDLHFTTDDSSLLPISTDVLVLILAIILIIVGLGIAYLRDWQILSPASETAQSDADTDGTTDEEIDVELLSDPERVERLLQENGGRMKQAKIVEDTGWSSAKVSQLLSEMEENDRIQKLRIGQENLISIPESDTEE